MRRTTQPVETNTLLVRTIETSGLVEIATTVLGTVSVELVTLETLKLVRTPVLCSLVTVVGA